MGGTVEGEGGADVERGDHADLGAGLGVAAEAHVDAQVRRHDGRSDLERGQRHRQ